LQYLIKTYTNEGDTVLDNCMGSGSTCIAAANTNRHYIGFEIEPKYFQIAKKRLYEADSRKDRLRKIQNEEHY
jgi:DNA modification methylase